MRLLTCLAAMCVCVTVVAAAAVLPGCSRTEARETLTISGSTTLLTMTEAAGQLYEKQHPGVRVLVQGGGSSAGIEDAANGTSDIGTSSRDLDDEEHNLGLVDHEVAIDAIALIVNPANPVSDLTTEQAKQIFEGKATSWGQVGGEDAPIVLVNRDEASGTREAFWKKVLDKGAFDKYAVILPGTGQVRSVVAGARNAIGYISVGFVTKDVKALRLNGIAPTKETVLANKYPVQRKLHFFTKGAAKGLAKGFIDFVLTPKVQEDIVGVEFVPVRH